MKNAHLWKPSKFIRTEDGLFASRDPKEVGVGSRLFVDVVAKFYHLHLKDHCRGKLLDLGCGKVPLFEAYRDFVTENICIDRSNSLHGSSYLDYELDLTQEIPLPDGEFDTIILSDVLEHISNPEHLWGEMSRILKTGGKILMNVPFFYWLHEKPQDYYRYTEFCLRRYAESSKLEIIVLKPLGGVPEISADIFAKNILAIPGIGKYAAMAVQCVCHKFIKTSIGSKISQRTSRNFPLGYFMILRKN